MSDKEKLVNPELATPADYLDAEPTVRRSGQTVPWKLIADEYITTNVTLAQLAVKWGVNMHSVTRWSAKEGWSKLREKAKDDALATTASFKADDFMAVFGKWDGQHLHGVDLIQQQAIQVLMANQEFMIDNAEFTANELINDKGKVVKLAGVGRLDPYALNTLAEVLLKVAKLERVVHGRDVQKVAVEHSGSVQIQTKDILEIRDRWNGRYGDGRYTVPLVVEGANPSANA